MIDHTELAAILKQHFRLYIDVTDDKLTVSLVYSPEPDEPDVGRMAEVVDIFKNVDIFSETVRIPTRD